MSRFTDRELEFLQSQRLGRLATVNAAGEPHVVPLTYRYNAELDTLDLFGMGLARSKKYRDVGRTGVAAFVVDDAQGQWRIRGVEVRGGAALIASGAKAINERFDDQFIRLIPKRIVGWGLDTDPYHPHSRSVG
jgi:pyridoxamine 5'-phosphate oxidase family protein